MARTSPRCPATTHQHLYPLHDHCETCGQPMWIAYHNTRTVTTLDGIVRLILHIRRCQQPDCSRYHQAVRPEAEGAWALPHGEFGLEVIAWVGQQRYAQHQTVPEMHQALQARGAGLPTHRHESAVSL